MIFDRLANGIQKHAKLIIVFWVVVLVCMSFFALKSGEVMSYDLTSMASDDSESIQGLTIIATEFPTAEVDVTSAPILVVYYENATELQSAKQLIKDLNSAAADNPNVDNLVSMDPTSDTGPGIIMAMVLLSDSVDSAVAYTPDLREFIHSVVESTGFTGQEYLTGMSPISYDMEHDAMADIEKIDPFTVLMILILVGLFFRSFVSSGTPPLTIGFAFVITMGLIYFLGQVLNIFFITNMMILVSMMGAGCDYCIFIIARYREELRNGLEHHDAVHQAIVWAGESITISGASVIIGFGAMSICSYSLISTMGICLALGILVALIAALTLIPSILQLVGDRIFWPTTMKAYEEGGKATKGWYAACSRVGHRYFDRSAKFSLKHAKVITVAAIIVSAPAVYLMVESEESYDMITAMLSGESGQGMDYIGEYADQGMVMPNYSIIEYKDSIATVTAGENGLGYLYWTDNWNNNVSKTLDTLYANIQKDDNIGYTEGPFVWDDMMKTIDDAGITDPDEKLEFMKDHLSSKFVLYLEGALAAVVEMGITPEVLFEGPGKIIENVFAEYSVTYDWDAEVQISEDKGLVDADAIVADMEARFASEHDGDVGKLLTTIVQGFNDKGVTNEMLVYGVGSMIDEQLAVYGITYDWDAAVAAVLNTGITDPTEVINAMVASLPELYQVEFKAFISAMNARGLTDEILVYGFGPSVDAVFESMSVNVDWDGMVAAAKATGLTDPDKIITAIEVSFSKQHPDLGPMLVAVINGMNAAGIPNDIIVNGFGPIVDYVMNVTTSTVGGPYVVTGSGDVTYINVNSATNDPAMSPRSMESIAVIESATEQYMTDNASLVVQNWDTGTAVVMYEVSEEVKSQFTLIEILVVVLIIILLFIVMRSYLIPIRSVLTILMSITWTLAATHLVFGGLLAEDVLWLVPILLLVICLGLGMDYDILLTTRIKENVMAKGMSNDDAIYHAVTHTGSVITICGLIMGGAFGTLMISGMPMLQEIGFALCFAILVDALLVRTYIVPAVMHLLGDWNWKGPGAKKRLAAAAAVAQSAEAAENKEE